MWLYNAFPKDKVKVKYGFKPTQLCLDHVRLSSVRFSNGGSGSFVSPGGLTLTNHHVGADCIHGLSADGKNYMKSGFYAPTHVQEAKCSNLEVDQFVGIDDVTSKISAAVKPTRSAAEAGQAQRAAMSNIEKECAVSAEIRCDIVTLFSGAVYNFYAYKRYTDVRLVFAPEFDAAFFGGDPGSAIGWCCEDTSASGVFFVHGDRPNIEPVHAAQWITGPLSLEPAISLTGPSTMAGLSCAAETFFPRIALFLEQPRSGTNRRRQPHTQGKQLQSYSIARIHCLPT